MGSDNPIGTSSDRPGAEGTKEAGFDEERYVPDWVDSWEPTPDEIATAEAERKIRWAEWDAEAERRRARLRAAGIPEDANQPIPAPDDSGAAS